MNTDWEKVRFHYGPVDGTVMARAVTVDLMHVYYCPCQSVFLFYVIKFEKLKYVDYEYPWWGHFIGGLLAASSMACVPAYMAYVVWRQEGTLMEVPTHFHPLFSIRRIRNQSAQSLFLHY